MSYTTSKGATPKTSTVLISCAIAEDLYTATQDIFEWAMPADGDATFRVVPISRLEASLAHCKLATPGAGGPPAVQGLLEHCMHLFNFVLPAYDALIAAGLLLDEHGAIKRFRSRKQLHGKAKEII